MTALAKRPERFTETAIDDEFVIMRLDNGEFFALSETAAAIWRLIDGTRDRNALLEVLGATFDGDRGRMAEEVDDFLAQLRAAGLVDEG